jgi:hypothetical protein
MAGKRQPGPPQCGHTIPVDVEYAAICRAESLQPESVSVVISLFVSYASSKFARTTDSIEAEYYSITTALRIKYNETQRGLRDDFAGSACIYQACSQPEDLAPDAIPEETGYQLKSILSGLLPGLLQMVAIVAPSRGPDFGSGPLATTGIETRGLRLRSAVRQTL